MRQVFETHTEDETIALGSEFSNRLSSGSVVACFGELGTGKTRFAKGICSGLGVREHVSSPTFTIINEYAGAKLSVYHFDFYRINSVADVREIGFEEYLRGDGVCLIEWADRVLELLPAQRFEVRFGLANDENSRTIVVEEFVKVAA